MVYRSEHTPQIDTWSVVSRPPSFVSMPHSQKKIFYPAMGRAIDLVACVYMSTKSMSGILCMGPALFPMYTCALPRKETERERERERYIYIHTYVCTYVYIHIYTYMLVAARVLLKDQRYCLLRLPKSGNHSQPLLPLLGQTPSQQRF